MKKSKALTRIEDKMETVEKDSFRYEVLSAVKEFKTDWIKLGQYLYTVKRDRLFKGWGYLTFEAYCSAEIGIKRQTAVKLLSSYYFLEKEEPALLSACRGDDAPVDKLPHYDAVNALRLAKGNKALDEEDYTALRKLTIDEGREPKDVTRQMRGMLTAARESGPGEARENRRAGTIRRFVSSLSRFRKEAASSKLLPQKIVRDIDRLIAELESELR